MILRAETSLRLRRANPADIDLLCRWNEDPVVRAAGGGDDWEWETQLHRHPAWREFLIAEIEGRPIGFLQIIDPEHEETRYWGEMPAGYRAIDIWIGEPDARGKGHGTRMMELAIERCFADPAVHTILIDPLETNTAAHRFYERLGFEFAGPRRFGDDVCLVYHLTRSEGTGGAGADAAN